MEQTFVLKNPSGVDEIRFKKSTENITLSKKNNSWVVNDTLLADNPLVDFFLQVSQRVRQRRPVPKVDLSQVLSLMETKGVVVTFIQAGNEQLQFQVCGDSDKQKTYMRSGDGIPYEVAVPGYNSYIGAFYELTANQWRNKVIFSSNHRTIKRLNLNYFAENRQVQFTDQNGFLMVDGAKQTDTTSLLKYIENYNYFEADGFINRGEYPRFDSLLLNADPAYSIAIVDIDPTFTRRLEIYPKIEGDEFYLGQIDDGELVVISASRLVNILDTKVFLESSF
jgi:hypothetical protein